MSSSNWSGPVCVSVDLTSRMFPQSGCRVNPAGVMWATSLRRWRWTRRQAVESHLQLPSTPRHGRVKPVALRLRTRRRKTDDKALNKQSLSGRTAAPRPDPLRPNLDSERRVRTGRTATGTFTSDWAPSELNKKSWRMMKEVLWSSAEGLLLWCGSFSNKDEMKWTRIGLLTAETSPL